MKTLAQGHVGTEDVMGTPLKSKPLPATADAAVARDQPGNAASEGSLVKTGPRPWLQSLGGVFGLRRRSAPPPAAVPVAPVAPAAAEAERPADAPRGTLDALYELAPRLRRAWSAETSTEPGRWSPQNPGLGQSAATACVVHDLLGGEIVEATVATAGGGTVSHFYNEIEGLPIDLTPGDFGAGSAGSPIAARVGYATMRDYVLSLPGVKARYELLRARLAEPTAAA
jgi:hypothetical protein